MTTDYRALCAELATELEAWEKADDQFSEGGTIRADANYGLAPRARAALAQPEPVEPTDEEIIRKIRDSGVSGVLISDVLLIARAVLARYGRPAITPIPVSERLPGAEDCDPSSQCWWFTPSEEKWIFWPIKWAGPECSHWLPAHALPLPAMASCG